MMDEYLGYRGEALRFLKENKVAVGDLIEVETDWGSISGLLVPRYQYDDDKHIVLKLRSGYNIGLAVNRLRSIRWRKEGEKPTFIHPKPPVGRENLPRVAVIGTGGTIASRVDYRTGAVHPAISAEDLYGLIPELSKVARIEPEVLMSVYSENLEPSHWALISERIINAINDGVDGVVITHGTDTMGYTAAALSFSIANVPIPVILVGAQRSSDRPSSDAVMNLIGAVSIAAKANISGVYVAMHFSKSDDKIALHRATRVRKNHTSARDAFESIGLPPAATWSNGRLRLNLDLPARGDGSNFYPRPKFDDRVVLLKFYPSLPGNIIESIVGSGVRAIVIEGSGLGHINSKNIPVLKRFIENGGFVFMTSQCIWGRVNMNVYNTGRDLLAIGVIPLDDMLPETALVKAMWALANSSSAEEMKSLMLSNIAGEFCERTLE